MSDVVIRVESLSKHYRLGTIGGATLRDDMQRWWAKLRGRPDPIAPLDGKSKPDGSDLWALRDVTFEVKRGEVLGIIGRNGAGKSTLLKILSRTTAPTSGQAMVKGRIGSLLEVGTGFHPELTGRENIYLNGSILGMKKAEIDRKIDEIIDFSGIERFIDTPVKRYSSGMYVRLAFAVAAHLEPEILVVDEVLAVGDANFQKKCLGKMQEVSSKNGRTVLFVSHNMLAVQSLCTSAILMINGELNFKGSTHSCVLKYLSATDFSCQTHAWDDLKAAPGNDDIKLLSIKAISRRTDDLERDLFDMATPVDIELTVIVLRKCVFHLTLHFVSDHGMVAFTSGGLPPRDSSGETPPGKYQLTCHIPANLLNCGGYSVNLLFVEDGVRANTILYEVIGFDVKDLTPRAIGSWHGREPGPVHPLLSWNARACS